MNRRRLSLLLGVLFLGALLMGPGPGVWLVNPASPSRPTTCYGVPVIWLWAVGWLGVQWTILWLAHRWLWTTRI